MDTHDETLKVGAVGVRLCTMGQGRPLLFLHGAGGLTPDLPFFQLLAQRFKILMPEHPGFGYSDDPSFLHNISDYAMFYLDLIETLDLRNLHVVGNSLGGWLAAEIAIRNCSRFASLTLLSPAGIKIKGLRPGDNFIWSPEESVRNLYHDQRFADRALEAKPSEEQLNTLVKNRYTVAKLAWQPRWCDPDLDKWLHRIKVPAQIMWGESDKMFPLGYAEQWRERLPDARLHVIANCGHLLHIEQFKQVADCIQTFVGGVS